MSAFVRRPISVLEASEILGVTKVAVHKRLARGTLLGVQLGTKGWMVCHESVLGEPVDEKAFRRMCDGYITIPEACDIVCVTDGMVVRMLVAGDLEGFRLNEKAWAVSRKSCEANLREYLARPRQAGRPRVLHEQRRPKKRAKRSRKTS